MGPQPTGGIPLSRQSMSTASRRVVEAVIVGQACEHGGGPAGADGELVASGRSTAVKVQSTKTLPWFASVLRIHMNGPTDWISQRRKKAGPTPRMVSPSPAIVLS